MSAKIDFEKQVSPRDLLKEASIMWKKCKNGADGGEGVALLARMHTEHREFCTAYPIVARYMCEMKIYSRKAFAQYLAHIQKHPWKSESDYLDSCAEYATILYKVTNAARHPSAQDILSVRMSIRKALQDETAEFKKALAAAEQATQEKERQAELNNAAELRSFYRGLPHGNVDLRLDAPPGRAPVPFDDLAGAIDDVLSISQYMSSDELLG
jgi:hypothetical protein